MSAPTFTVALSSAVQVTPSERQYRLQAAEPIEGAIALDAYTGLAQGMAQLQQGNTTAEALVQGLATQVGQDAGTAFTATLQQLDERGWLNYAVPPLAVAQPMVETAQLKLDAPHWTQAQVSLSRFAYQHTHQGSMVLESPLSAFRVQLLDWRAGAIVAQLAQPCLLGTLTPPPHLGAEAAFQFLNLLWATHFLTVETEEAPELQLWDFHNLLFHSRSRQGRHDYAIAEIATTVWDEFPVAKPPMSEQIVALPQLNIDAIRQRDKTLTTAIEKRESIRDYDDNNPITLEQLGEFLFRAARLTERYTQDAAQQAQLKAQFGEDFDWGELSRRPYPCGGAMYELEIYPVVRRCDGVQPGLYHYDPLNHQLAQLDAPNAEIQALLKDAHQASGTQGMPQVLLIITARFGRLFRKYRSLAYALVLKHVGVLYQNLYLVATNMGLAPCALGSGDSDTFARATGLDYVAESSVGEFLLGSLPNAEMEASGIEDIATITDVEDEAIADTTTDAASASESAIAASEVEAAQADAVGMPASTQPTSEILTSEGETIAGVEPVAQEPEVIGAQVDGVGFPSSTQPTPSSSSLPTLVSSSPPAVQHPHDLDDRLPGLADLRNQTLGDPRITIVILDGNPDYTLSCFEGAEISKVLPYWHESAEPVPAEAYLKFQAIDNNDDLDKDAKLAAQNDAFSESLLKRILGDNHACHITSTIAGQDHTPAPGLAPRCQVINVPLNTTGNNDEFISPLNLARAFELALELGANLIHCAACRPTRTGEGEELLLQALQKCQDNNILIVAPAGNNEGECWCMPASLPGVLSVGALKPDGTPYKFSNWGGNNELEGIMAPGGDILGAQPANEEPVRLKGTSMSAPVMTGLCGLLMSLQLQQGKPVDAEAIRAALLNTAIPCTAEDTDEPERCLRGKVNLPGAMALLFGGSITISFAGEQVTRTEHGAIAPSVASNPSPVGLSASTQPTATPVESEAGAIAAPWQARPDAVGFPSSTQPTAITASTQPKAAPSLPIPPSPTPSKVTPSTAYSGHVYALGAIAYNFGDETRRETFAQKIADPYDARQMVEHLDNNPDEAQSLIWLLQLGENTLYALDPKGPFANDIYEMFLLMLNGQLEPEASAEFIERISIPGRQTGRTVELLAGEVVPVLNVRNPRGMYGWNVSALVEGAVAAIETGEDEAGELLREGLVAFVNRVYHDLHNVGQTSRDRALNFAATNIFQATSSFVDAIASQRCLQTIAVEKSPYCRLNSDCWDVVLTFYDPEHGKRSRQVFRFTVDVADGMPVTVGRIKQWSIPGAASGSK